MSYLVVRGRFELGYIGERRVGSRPDGDSVWFRPNVSDRFRDLDWGRTVDFNEGGLVQLRFEGVDALELSYNGSHHQLAWAAVSARDYLLRRLGFLHVGYAPSEGIPRYVRYAQPPAIPGYILSRRVDTYGRPIAFVFTGAPPQADGTQLWLEPGLVAESINAQLMNAGEVYPLYYNSLPWDLRNLLTTLADRAWRSDRGIWTVDASLRGFDARRQADLEELALWPKLYRRLTTYFEEGYTGVAGFDDWLRTAELDDEVWILSRGQAGHLHDLFERKGNRLRMLFWPDDIVITPR
jgi:hypothetical protein